MFSLIAVVVTAYAISVHPLNALVIGTIGVVSMIAIYLIFATRLIKHEKKMRYIQNSLANHASEMNEQMNEANFEPFVEDLKEIVRPYMSSSNAASQFQSLVEEGLENHGANNWRRAFGKIDEKDYFVIYSNGQTLELSSATYVGKGGWKLYLTDKTEANKKLTVIAFSDKLAEEGDINASNTEN
jgi:hypothetical protein